MLRLANMAHPADEGVVDEGIEQLITEAEIARRVAELAAEISRDYAGRNPLLLGALKGSWIFVADLVRRLTVPCRVDFLTVSSYGSARETSGSVRITADATEPVEGRDLLLVEDIVDTGLTLRYLLDEIRGRRPASLKTCVLLDKACRRQVEVPIDYRGFFVPDGFVVGYGLDCDGSYRQLPFVGIMGGGDGTGTRDD